MKVMTVTVEMFIHTVFQTVGIAVHGRGSANRVQNNNLQTHGPCRKPENGEKNGGKKLAFIHAAVQRPHPGRTRPPVRGRVCESTFS